MKNVIAILIDSVFSDCISTGRTKVSSTPFIDRLMKDGIYCENCYSYGPYTDAASNALYTGNPTMDDYGYFFGINSSQYNHFRIFKEQGYETYGFYYPYYLIGSTVEQYIDHSIYTSGFWYKAIWDGKLEYYSTILKKRPLTKEEMNILRHFFSLLFDVWTLFYKNLNSQDCSSIIVSALRKSDESHRGSELLDLEISKYKSNCDDYILEVLRQGMSHNLAKVNDFDPDFFTKRDFIKKQVYDRHRKDLERISRVNKNKNLINHTLEIKKTFFSLLAFFKNRKKENLRFISNEVRCIYSVEEMKRKSIKPYWQFVASMQNQITALCHLLNQRENSSSPFYVSLHVLEPHNNISFFSYDIEDKKLIDEEIDCITSLCSNVGRSFSGNIVYQAAIRYVDLCIERLFGKLEELRLLDNTVVVLYSDHGSSYSFNPIRDKVVNTFYNENYKIPLVLWEKNIKEEVKGEYSGPYMSDVIFPTICDYLSIDTSGKMKGQSIFKKPSGYRYSFIEYMGPGCPDLFTKEIWIAIRSSNYLIAYKNTISSDLDVQKPCEVYCLSTDAKQKKNLADDFLGMINPEIKDMQCEIVRRFNEIKANAFEFREHIDYVDLYREV